MAFVARKYDGTLRGWGPAAAGGAVPAHVSRLCPQVTAVHHTQFAFFAVCAPRPECVCRGATPGLRIGGVPYTVLDIAGVDGGDPALVCPDYTGRKQCLQKETYATYNVHQISCEYACPEKVHRGPYPDGGEPEPEWKTYESELLEACPAASTSTDDEKAALLRTLRLAQHGQSAPSAVLQLAPCAFSGRAWWLGAAQRQWFRRSGEEDTE